MGNQVYDANSFLDTSSTTAQITVLAYASQYAFGALVKITAEFGPVTSVDYEIHYISGLQALQPLQFLHPWQPWQLSRTLRTLHSVIPSISGLPAPQPLQPLCFIPCATFVKLVNVRCRTVCNGM